MATIVRILGAADPDVVRWCEVYCAGRAAEAEVAADPRELAIRLGRTDGWRWLAVVDGAVAGVAELSGDFLRLYVEPAHRRRGVGTTLLAAVRSTMVDEPLHGMAAMGEAGEAFATNSGAVVLMRLVVLSQPLASLRLAAPTLPAGFALVTWRDRAPERLIHSYARVKRHILDAPDARLQVAGDWTAASVRDWEAELAARGETLWVAVAVVGDEVVALTELTTGPGSVASQHDTVVVPAHRGRHVARGLKLANLGQALAARPDLTKATSTINAANAPMIATNIALGYREVRQRLLYELAASSAAATAT